MAEAISTMHHELQQHDQIRLDSVLLTLDTKQVQAIQRAITFKTSTWLTVLPTIDHHFDLSATEFRDALTVRYHRPLLKMPATCDGCGAAFSYEHALDCKKGCLITRRHNEVRDTLGDLSSIVYNDIIREPVIQEACEVAGEPSLIADLGVRGVWQPQVQALFDVRVIDTDVPSHVQRSVAAVLASAETEKYNNAAIARRASFTPFVVSVDGALGCEATNYLKHLSEHICMKWGKSYGEVMGGLRASLSFAIIRATDLCLQGSRIRWRNVMDMADGIGLPYIV